MKIQNNDLINHAKTLYINTLSSLTPLQKKIITAALIAFSFFTTYLITRRCWRAFSDRQLKDTPHLKQKAEQEIRPQIDQVLNDSKRLDDSGVLDDSEVDDSEGLDNTRDRVETIGVAQILTPPPQRTPSPQRDMSEGGFEVPTESKSPEPDDLFLDALFVDIGNESVEDTETSLKKTKTVRDLTDSENVKNWLRKAKRDPILKNSETFFKIDEMHTLLETKHDGFEDRAFEIYNDYEAILSAIIKVSTASDLDQILKQHRDELLFNQLKKNYAHIREEINSLKDDEEGTFKSSMQALLDLVAPPLVASRQSPKIEQEEPEEAPESSALLVTVKDLTFNNFTDFQKAIFESQSSDARNAFITYSEIVQSGVSNREQFHEKINEYRDAEEAVRKAIKDIVEPMEELLKPINESMLLDALVRLEKIFDSISAIDDKPFLQDLLIQNTSQTSKAYLFLKNRKKKPIQNNVLPFKIDKILYDLKTLLCATSNERIGLLIELGNKVLADPETAFDKYLHVEANLRFEALPPDDSSEVEGFLTKIQQNLDKRSYTPEDLLAFEAFISVTLYAYIINSQVKLDPTFRSIIGILKDLRANIDEKMSVKGTCSTVADLRKNEQNQKFYRLLKDKIENTPSYPKNFWFNPRSEERMKIPEPLLELIGVRIASPNPLGDPARLIHQNVGIGYEIYFYPPSKTEKPKLLLFITNPCGSSFSQDFNDQLGLFGDPKILEKAEEVVSNITSTEVLEGYEHDLREGSLDIIASGFDNTGSAAMIVANRLAVLYSNTHVTSISAGSTSVVTTEDAYNMNRTDNFYPIRLKYYNDGSVDRTLTKYVGDFSEDSYHTFPLLVRYNQNAVDINRHNKEEYGNVDNFVPAMTNPLIVLNIYQELSRHILYTKSQVLERLQDLEWNLAASLCSQEVDFLPQQLLQVGRLDELIHLGNRILKTMNAYDGQYLKLDPYPSQTSSLIQVNDIKNPMQNKELTSQELEHTIDALQHAIHSLKNSDVMDLLTPEQAFSLLIAADTLLINSMQSNLSIGKYPQFIDLLSELRDLSGSRLDVLYRDRKKKRAISQLFMEHTSQLDYLASKALKSFTPHKELIEKKDVVGIFDFEERFLEYLGFRITTQDRDKIGSEVYVSKLYTSKEDQYDISLFTPDDPMKKQRIVICCNGTDQLGPHGLYHGVDFGAGDTTILARSAKIKESITKQLAEQFRKHGFNAGDVEIVVTGFGAEGAVATAVGYMIAKKYDEEGSRVISIGFGAPRFTTAEGAVKIRKQQNFIPLRFLSPTDTRFEWKMHTLSDYPVSDQTYYTIPHQFRVVGVLDLGGHTTRLYGDVQAIKTTMKKAKLMREVANEKRRLKATMKDPSVGGALLNSADTETEQAALPKRIVIDTRRTLLADLSSKSADELKTVEPGKLISTIKYCIELSEKKPISARKASLIKTFFDHFILAMKNEDINEKHPIKNEFYLNLENHGYKPDQLFGGKWTLQKIISTDLKEAMKAVKHRDQQLPLKETNELILRRSFYRGILAGDLRGNRYKPAGGGVNGAVFFKHLESDLKKPEALLPDETVHLPFLGVFKPHPETVREFKGWFDVSQWGERIKTIAGMEAHLNPEDPDKRVHNEIFAYELFHIFGFDQYIKFPTTLQFPNKNDSIKRPASFCSFMAGYDIVASHVVRAAGKLAKSNILDQKNRNYSEMELHIWEMSKLFDFLTGNLDGHEGNAFVKVENDKIVDAVNFDYDKAFAIDNPTKISNQYKWVGLKISQNDFTETTKKALKKMLGSSSSEEKVNMFLTLARKDSKRNFSDEQEKLLRQRLDVLKQVAEGKVKKLSDLKEYMNQTVVELKI